ncbi:hypothetical protein QH494_06230 [Sphingomonas sp. AR_OL41]|uniref:hypothetical protein n=1 Tax=Sphingomonas sp. AR_OL41 TaxID=3042729 RepID=UPI00247FD6E3|nr:hypothetical protein [Sphingomonas sp. AR_OL41]MDH7971776.1 hypothetical protein [Sphingomonas sp. AR_OL41]
MRGLILLASTRVPYMRAGLAWAAREPLKVDIRELDAPRLLELLADPVLTVTLGQGDGSFRPFPALDKTVTPELVQEMIDDLAAELPPIGADTPAVSPIEQQLIDAQATCDRQADALDAARKREEALAESLSAAGFTSVDQLISAHSSAVSQASSLGSQLGAANETITVLTNERDGATSRVSELEGQVAKLTAAATKAPKPKSAGTDKAS